MECHYRQKISWIAKVRLPKIIYAIDRDLLDLLENLNYYLVWVA